VHRSLCQVPQHRGHRRDVICGLDALLPPSLYFFPPSPFPSPQLIVNNVVRWRDDKGVVSRQSQDPPFWSSSARGPYPPFLPSPPLHQRLAGPGVRRGGGKQTGRTEAVIAAHYGTRVCLPFPFFSFFSRRIRRVSAEAHEI